MSSGIQRPSFRQNANVIQTVKGWMKALMIGKIYLESGWIRMRKQLTRLKNLKYECILFVVSNNLYMFKDVLMVSVEHSGTRNQNRSAHASHEVLRYPLVIKLGNGQSPINGGFKWFCWKWPASQCIGTFLTESNMIHQYFSKFGDQWMSNHWRFCSSVVKPSNWHVVLPFFA